MSKLLTFCLLFIGDLPIDVADAIEDTRHRDSALSRISARAWFDGDNVTSEDAFSKITSESVSLETAILLAAHRRPGEGEYCYRRLGDAFRKMYVDPNSRDCASDFRRVLIKAGFSGPEGAVDYAGVPFTVEELSFDGEPEKMAAMFEIPPNTIQLYARVAPFAAETIRRRGPLPVISFVSKLGLEESSAERLLAVIAARALTEKQWNASASDIEALTKPGPVRVSLEFLRTQHERHVSAEGYNNRDLRRESFLMTAIPATSTSGWWLIEAAHIEHLRGYTEQGLQYIAAAEKSNILSTPYDGFADAVTLHSEAVLRAVALCIEEARLGMVRSAVDRLFNLNLPDNVLEAALEQLGAAVCAGRRDSRDGSNFSEFSSNFVRANLMIGAMHDLPPMPGSRWSECRWAEALVVTCESTQEKLHLALFERVTPSIVAVSQPPKQQNALLKYLLDNRRTQDIIEFLFLSCQSAELCPEMLRRCLLLDDPAVAILAGHAVLSGGRLSECGDLAIDRLIRLSDSEQAEVRYASLSLLVALRDGRTYPIGLPQRAHSDEDTRFLDFMLRTPTSFDYGLFEAAIASRNRWVAGAATKHVAELSGASAEASLLIDRLLETPRSRFFILTLLRRHLPSDDRRRVVVERQLHLLQNEPVP